MKPEAYNIKHKARLSGMFQASGFRFQECGYTLIELMVAIGVFSIVVAMTSSMFITSMKGQEKALTSQNVSDSGRYAMEMMSREIRMFDSSKSYTADTNGGACSTVCRFQFVSTMPHRDGKSVEFKLDPVQGMILFDDDTADGTPAAAITSSGTKVTSLSFTVSGAGHERITIVMMIESAGTKEDVKTHMDLQTTISPRRL